MTYNVAGQHPTLTMVAMLERHILFPVLAKTGKVAWRIESYSSKSSVEADAVQAEVLDVNKELQMMFHKKRTCPCRWRSESMNKELGAIRDWLFVRMTKDSGYQGKAISPIYVVPCIAFHKECLDSTIHITVLPKCTLEPRFIVGHRV